MRLLMLLTVTSAFFAAMMPVARAADTVVTIQTRPGVTQRFSLLVPDRPKAAVVLFSGGAGRVPVDRLQPGQFIKKGNFLVRIRYDLRDRGLIVAIVDIPSDRQKAGLSGFRFSDEHAQDIAAVIDYLKGRADIPIWLVGTSRGTESVAALGVKLGSRLAGIVLTSSITVTNSGGSSILGLPLNKVSVPALVVAHKNDQCFVSPPGRAQAIADALSASPRKKVMIVEGGKPPQSEACEALAQHGYFGIESEVAASIADFITSAGR
jgi:pimeloyl-ACP methyl ester carboxylesterase